MSRGEEDGILSRWTRRKAAVEAEQKAEQAVAPEPVAVAPDVEPETRTDAEILEELGLPDPEAMEMGADFKAFLADAVPEHLRRKALRKLWLSNPVLACVDGLNDYDGDFTQTGVGPEGLKTVYQVGKGMLRDLVALDDEAAGEGDGDEADGELAEAQTAATETEPEPAADNVDDSARVMETAELDPDHPEADPAKSVEISEARLKRMKFEF